MKNENAFSGSMGSRTTQPAEAVSAKPVTVTSFSQPHVLQQKMMEEKLTHGETVMANLSPVRLQGTPDSMILYFCPMQSIEVVNSISSGDGASIPAEAKVEGLTVPGSYRSGYYTLKNVMLTSNGTMQVKATAATVWEEMMYERF